MSEKLALVSGGNRGIGKAIVAGLARDSDIHVLLGSRDPEKGQRAAASIDGKVSPVALDLGDRTILKGQIAAIGEQFGAVSILVNNAGILEDADLLKLSGEAFERSLRVNLVAAFDLIRWLVPGMAKQGYGRIVNLSSGWGAFAEGLGGPPAYAVSKAALNALTRTAARAMPAGVKINSMCPGWVRTEMGGANAERSPEEGADTAVWLATLPGDGPSGGFFRDRKRIEW